MVESIQAYDVHAETMQGHVHFQVLTKIGTDDEKVVEYAKNHAKLESYELAAEQNYVIAKLGHTQGPQGDQATQIKDVGYAIYKVHPA